VVLKDREVLKDQEVLKEFLRVLREGISKEGEVFQDLQIIIPLISIEKKAK